MKLFTCVGSVPDIERYVARQIECGPIHSDACVGIIHKGKPVCGVLLTAPVKSESPQGFTFDAQVCIGAESPRWCTRKNLRDIFNFFFNDIGLTRLTTLAQCKNTRANRLNLGLGFQREGLLRQAIEGQDAYIYSMLKDECRWLEKTNG